jgi:hypothetical protein
LDLCSVGTRLGSRLGRWLSWLRFLPFSSVPGSKYWKSTSTRPQPPTSKSYPMHRSSYRLTIGNLDTESAVKLHMKRKNNQLENLSSRLLSHDEHGEKAAP